jgi:type VI protein secretion system component VasF
MQGQRFNRTAGDAPNLGRVARLHGATPSQEKGPRRRRKGGMGMRPKEATPGERHQNKVIMTWTVLLLVIMLGILAFFFWSWLRSRMG